MADPTQSKKYQKSYFDVLGICCPSEVPLIESVLEPLDGVKDYSVIVPTRTVIVVHDTHLVSQVHIAKALNQARLEANVRQYGDTGSKKRWPSPYTMLSGLFLALSFMKYFFHPFRWLAVGAVAVGVYPIAANSFASIIRFRLDINVLALISVIGTVAMKNYTEAATIVFFFTIAEWLETKASHKAGEVMLALINLAPQKAVIANTGKEVDVNEVTINTDLAVKAGETIPIDGIVVEGNCEIDEKTLTGEPVPVPKQRNSHVWAGTINLNGYITVRTVALAKDCVVAKMAKLVEEAQSSKTRTQRFIDSCSLYYTPAVIVIAAGVAVVPAALRLPNLKHWFHLALVVLVSACPCGLILSTPVGTFCALTKAATQGVLIKGGDYLELLSNIKVVAFDKTGTISRGEFVVRDFRSLSPDISLHTLLYWVSSIESKSSHPMAAALVDHAQHGLIEPKPDAVDNYHNFPGEGIYGRIDARDIYVGNKRIARRAGCPVDPNLERDMNGGQTVGYICCDATLVGVFALSDACRSGVVEGIKELKSLGVKVAMLTGDSHGAAMQAQQELEYELEMNFAELLPEGKARMITDFKKEIGPTAMVGDGINDAPALATADVGISMGISGSALASETAHVILMSNDIRKIPETLRLSRRTHRKVIENVLASISIKGFILGLGFAGHPLVWAAVLADVGSCLIVILNSMLLLSEVKRRPNSRCYRVSGAVNDLRNSRNPADSTRQSLSFRNTLTTEGCCKAGCSLNADQVSNAASEEKNMSFNSGSYCDKKNNKNVRERNVEDEEAATSTVFCRSGCCDNTHGLVSQLHGAQIEYSIASSSLRGSGSTSRRQAQETEPLLPPNYCSERGDVEKCLSNESSLRCNSKCCSGRKNQVDTSCRLKEKSSDPRADLERGLLVKDGKNCGAGCCS